MPDPTSHDRPHVPSPGHGDVAVERAVGATVDPLGSGHAGVLVGRGPADGDGGRGAGPGPRRARWPARTWAVLVGLAFAAPMVFLVLKVAGEPAAVVEAVTDGRLWPPLRRTLVLATSVAATSAVIGTLTGWLVVRTDLPGRRLWRILLPLPLVVPSFIGAFTFLIAFGPGGMASDLLAPLGITWGIRVRGFVGSWVVLSLFTYPYVHLLVASRLNQLPPSLEEAARLLGRRPRQVFFSVVVPQLRPAITGGALLVFLYVVSDFGVVDLMRHDVLTRVIYASRLADVALSFTLSLSLGVLALLVASLERMSTRRDVVAGARSVGGLQVRLGRWKALASAVVAGVLGLALVVPVGVLVTWTVRGLLVGASSSVLDDPTRLWGPFTATLRVSLVAALVAVVVVTPVGHLAIRVRDRLAATTSTIVVAGFALPGLAISLALVYWLRSTPVYQTEIALVTAYVIHFGAQALRGAEVAVASVPHQMHEASRVLGVAGWRRWRRIDLPLMLPSLLAGGGLVLLSVMKELPATLLLSPNGFDTLATLIWSAASEALWTTAAIPSLLLLAMSGVLTWLLVIRRSDAL